MLVLLIMFIITIPVQTHAVKIDLPAPNEDASNVDPEKNKLMISAAGVISWNGPTIDLEQLAPHLDTTKALPVETEIPVPPDQFARYFIIELVIATIKRRGYANLGIVGQEQHPPVFCFHGPKN